MTSLCVTIRKGTKEYEFHGIRHVSKNVKWLYVFATKCELLPDGYLYLIKNARITDVMVTECKLNQDDINTLERLEHS